AGWGKLLCTILVILCTILVTSPQKGYCRTGEGAEKGKQNDPGAGLPFLQTIKTFRTRHFAHLLFVSSPGSFLCSQKSFSTAVSEPGQGLPQFTTVRYIDDQLFVQYDSNTRKKVPKMSWIKKVEEDDPEYWVKETQISQSKEQIFRENVRIAMKRYNQTGGE
uniref:MHC class I-like antigen recognition-like domain-containing protein n=1 Tax=Salvator merianae TaxID=96440 RepID=A0A8D0B8L0_SALMN